MGRKAAPQVAANAARRYELTEPGREMTVKSPFLAISIVTAIVAAPVAAQERTIGVIAPLSGDMAILGQQVVSGAFVASRVIGIRIVTADDQCSPEGGAKAAQKMIEERPSAVVGFLCTEALEAAAPLLKDASIPIIVAGARANSLTDRHDKTGWPLLRLAPRADTGPMATAELLTKLWRTENFAIVDDGTIAGRELAEAFRVTAEAASLKPVFTDTYRPDMDNQVGLVGRLRKAGATHVFVGGSKRDIAIIGQDAAKRGMKLTLAGGENLRRDESDIELAAGTIMTGLPEWTEIASPQALQELSTRAVLPEGYVLPAFAATEIAAALPASEPGTDALPGLTSQPYQTALGEIRFDAKGDLTNSPYRLYRFDGAIFVPLEASQ